MMWLRRADYNRLLEDLAAARERASFAESSFQSATKCIKDDTDARVLRAEDALADERRAYSRDVRHFASMWLRHQKSLPLPKTAEEKADAVTEQAAHKPELNEVQLAMREANRREAAKHGVDQEQADADFEKYAASNLIE